MEGRCAFLAKIHAGNTEGSKAAIRYDVRLAGVGGQGLILAGMILGEAASIYGGLQAVQTQTYAPLVRGAPSMSEVIVSDDPIDDPVVDDADVLLALVQDSLDEYGSAVKPTGWIIVPEGVTVGGAAGSARVASLPLARAAAEAGAAPVAATMVALGVVSRRIGLADDCLRRTVALRVPRDSRDANLRALEAGFRLA